MFIEKNYCLQNAVFFLIFTNLIFNLSNLTSSSSKIMFNQYYLYCLYIGGYWHEILPQQWRCLHFFKTVPIFTRNISHFHCAILNNVSHYFCDTGISSQYFQCKTKFFNSGTSVQIFLVQSEYLTNIVFH